MDSFPFLVDPILDSAHQDNILQTNQENKSPEIFCFRFKFKRQGV